MLDIIQVSLYLILFISIFLLIKSFVNKKELNYTNPFFYFFVFLVLYLGIPALFAEEFRFYYQWEYSDEDIIYSNILVIIILVLFTFIFYKFNKIHLKLEKGIRVSKFIKLIWYVILFYLLFVVMIKFQENTLFFKTDYLGVEDKYQLKKIAYLLITISILYYSENKKMFVFIPNILVAILDMLEGSRTVAFIVLIPIFISFAIYNKKTYLVWIIALLSLMIVVGIFRSEFASNQYDVPTYISALGEFRETYLLLPNMITNHEFVGKGDVGNIMSSITLPFLQPLREEMLETFVYSGSYAAKLVGRGYGLGNNFIVESIFYGYLFIICTVIFVYLYLYMIYKIVQKINLVYAIIIISYSVVFIRLIVREGFLNNFTLMIFILMIYMLPFLIINHYINKIRIKK